MGFRSYFDSSSSGGGGGTPGGVNGDLQYNNAGAFGGLTPGAGVATLLAGTPSGTGGLAGTTSPTFTTPVLGVASGTSLLLSGGLGRGAGAFEYSFDWRPSSGTAAGKTAIIQDLTLLTGDTALVIKAGAGQAAGLLQVINTVSQTCLFVANSGSVTIGDLSLNGVGGGNITCISGTDIRASSFAAFTITNPTLRWPGTPDLSVSRISAGVLGVGTGAAGSFAGTIKATLQTATNAVTGLTPGALAALTTATIQITDGTGTVYRVPCITP